METQEHPIWQTPLVPGVTFQVALVTPDMAAEFLGRINVQRNAVIERVDRYALDMAQLTWMFTGDPFRFNADGEFIDGQHRALGIKESGISQPVLIIRHLPNEVMRVLDVGLKRTFAHLLQMAHVPSATHVATLTRRHYQWTEGLYGHRDIPRIPDPLRQGLDPSHEELWSHFGRHSRLIDAVRVGGTLWKQTNMQMISRGTFTLAYMVLGDIDPYKRDEFLGMTVGTIEPTTARAGYPPLVLGDRLNRFVSGADRRPPDWQMLSLTFRAWNLWLAGKPAGALKRPSAPDLGKLSIPIDPAKWDGTIDEEAA
jgi:hypothetical protein